MTVKFRSIDLKKDIQGLYEYMTDEENQILFSSFFRINDICFFEKWLTEKLIRSYHDFFMIDNSKGETIGFTFSYEFYLLDLHCKYTLCLYKEYQDIGLGAYAAIKMVDYLFRNYPLQRIFISVYDYNKKSLVYNIKGGFEEVGVLPEYKFYNGKYFPIHILTINREKFYDKCQKALENNK